MEKITRDQLDALFDAIAKKFEENEELLGDMDSKMGDGDLGLTMRKGFGGLPDFLRAMDERDLSKTLRKTGMELTDLVPSTMGMLMGTGISYGGKELNGRQELDAEGFALFLKGFCAGIIKRGKCDRGDRTVLDSIQAASDAASSLLATRPDASLREVCQRALEGAQEGLEATKSMLPRFGKAAVHTNIALGTVDQGAKAGELLIEGMADYILGERD